MAKKIHINEIEDGYILAETLLNKYKQVLISKGTTLSSSKHSKILSMWGIEEIFVFENISDEIVGTTAIDASAEIEREILAEINWTIKDKNDKFLLDTAVLVRLEAKDRE